MKTIDTSPHTFVRSLTGFTPVGRDPLVCLHDGCLLNAHACRHGADWAGKRGPFRAVLMRTDLITADEALDRKHHYLAVTHDMVLVGGAHILAPNSTELDVLESIAPLGPDAFTWTPALCQLILSALEWSPTPAAQCNAAVIRYAAAHRGYITRQKVQDIAGRHRGSVLTGFARPTAHRIKTLQEFGLLSTGIPPLLQPSTRPGLSGHWTLARGAY